MTQSPLYDAGYRPLFSGHETFPLRYGWLKKAHDAVVEDAASKEKSIFRNDKAIARFGVGKNMVASMRHWATFCDVIKEDSKTHLPISGEIGDFLFGKDGVDPYLENPASLWLLHWQLCSGRSMDIKTTWYWVFNHYNNSDFKREDLVEGILKFSESRGWREASRVTIQRDVECFVRMYESRSGIGTGIKEENLESPFSELGLIRGLRGHFHLVRGPKPTLPNGVFASALESFWNRFGTTKTISFEHMLHDPGSPGRIFLLDETTLSEKLLTIEDFTRGAFKWSETAGLKQVIRKNDLSQKEIAAFRAKDHA